MYISAYIGMGFKYAILPLLQVMNMLLITFWSTQDPSSVVEKLQKNKEKKKNSGQDA